MDTPSASSDSPQPIPPRPRLGPGPAGWQRQWYQVIFGHQTPAGKAFDVLLLLVIVLSVAAVMLESVRSLQLTYGGAFVVIEWIVTLLFTLEFLARLICVDRPWRYVFSFFGFVDIVSLLPSYLRLFFPGAHTLATIRTLRLLRVFRVLKLARHVSEAQGLLRALKQTWPKITVFLAVLVCSILILGTVMYLVEVDAGSGFDSIPTSVYWAIVTMTTVGYGDIAPATPLGKVIASLMMLLGYAIIIVPTGIFSAEVVTGRRAQSARSGTAGGDGSDGAGSDGAGSYDAAADKIAELDRQINEERSCPACGEQGLAGQANYCHTCGAVLGTS